MLISAKIGVGLNEYEHALVICATLEVISGGDPGFHRKKRLLNQFRERLRLKYYATELRNSISIASNKPSSFTTSAIRTKREAQK